MGRHTAAAAINFLLESHALMSSHARFFLELMWCQSVKVAVENQTSAAIQQKKAAWAVEAVLNMFEHTAIQWNLSNKSPFWTHAFMAE